MTTKRITKKKLIHRMKICFAVTLFLIIFGAVYEHFSHGAYSNFMLYAFAVPMIFEMLPGLLLYTRMPIKCPLFSIRLYDAGVVTLTLASLVKGALDIYGTTNRLLIVYPVIGVLLFALALFFKTGYDRYETREPL